jgi:hypothetical protein
MFGFFCAWTGPEKGVVEGKRHNRSKIPVFPAGKTMPGFPGLGRQSVKGGFDVSVGLQLRFESDGFWIYRFGLGMGKPRPI